MNGMSGMVVAVLMTEELWPSCGGTLHCSAVGRVENIGGLAMAGF